MKQYRQALEYLNAGQLREALKEFSILVELADDLGELSHYQDADRTTKILEELVGSIDAQQFVDAEVALKNLLSIWSELSPKISRLQKIIKKSAARERQELGKNRVAHSIATQRSYEGISNEEYAHVNESLTRLKQRIDQKDRKKVQNRIRKSRDDDQAKDADVSGKSTTTSL